MKSWVAAAALICVPPAVFFVAGAVWLGQHSLLLVAGLLLAVCWVAAYWLLRRWFRGSGYPPDAPEPWTAHDQQALQLIKDHERELNGLSPEQLADRATQEKLLAELALKLARHYHPGAEDPLGPLTPAEILAAARQATDAAARWLDYYVPGGQTVTIDRWRRLTHLPSWLATLGGVAVSGRKWLRGGSFRHAPAGPAIDLVESRAAGAATLSLSRILLRKSGRYLIELYSGRLRTHPQPLRESSRVAASPASDTATSSQGLDEVTLAVLGPRQSGKSSLIRALLGVDRASVDHLPGVRHVSRHRVQLAEPLARLVVLEAELDRHAGPTQLGWISQHADLAVLVCDATQPADETYDKLESLFSACAERSVVAVLTHVDQLIEPLDDWKQSDAGVDEAMWAASGPWREKLKSLVAAVVPVCTDVRNARVYGVDEWFVPVVSAELNPRQSTVLLAAIKRTEGAALDA